MGPVGSWTPKLGSLGGGDLKVGICWVVDPKVGIGDPKVVFIGWWTPDLGSVGGGDPKVGVGWVMKTPKFGFFGDGPRSWGWRPQR